MIDDRCNPSTPFTPSYKAGQEIVSVGGSHPDRIISILAMATGIETAGLVLAAFPVLIKGIKAWVEGVETVKQWRTARRDLKSYAVRLQSQQVTCVDTLEQLLSDIVQSEKDLSVMLEDPGGELWQRPVYKKRLGARLDRSCDPFLQTLSEVRAFL